MKRPSINELRVALSHATIGNWEVRDGDPKKENHVAHVRGLNIYGNYGAIACKYDANFIALAHNEMAGLLDYIEHLESVIEYDGKQPPTQADYESFAGSIHDEGDDEMYPGELHHR